MRPLGINIVEKKEFFKRLKQLKITHAEFADLAGINKGSIVNFRVVPLWAIRIVELLEEQKELYKGLKQ